MRTRREFIKLGAVGAAIGCTPLTLSAVRGISLFGPDEGPFLKACAGGDTETVRKLLAGDPSLLSAKDKEGRSGFALALLAGFTATAQFLRESGFQADLHEAALALDWDRFNALAEERLTDIQTLVNADHPIGGCAMWAAAAGGAGSGIWRVYSYCGDPNCNPRNERGSTAVQRALRLGDLPNAEVTAATLLSNYADPDPIANADLPPLHIAAERGSFELVEMLIRLGADINRKDRNGRTPLQLAEAAGHEKTWKLIKAHDRIPRTCRTSRAAFNADGQAYRLPDLNGIDSYRQIRMVGSSHGNLEYVQKEVEADPRTAHAVATTSERAVEACAHTGRKPIVELLLRHGAPYSLPTAVMLNDTTTVKKLLDEDPNRIYERGAHDFALLWYPIIGGGDLDMMQLLLDRGAKVEEQHFLGTTALHWASSRDSVEMVELLVDNGADLNRVGRKFKAEGERPLQVAKNEQVAAFLKSRGAE